jgi:hypothetical protein
VPELPHRSRCRPREETACRTLSALCDQLHPWAAQGSRLSSLLNLGLGLPRQEKNGRVRAGRRRGRPGQKPSGPTGPRTSGPHAHRDVASRQEQLEDQAEEKEFPALDHGRTHGQTDVRPGAPEQRNGLFRGREPGQSRGGGRLADRVADPAKDQPPRPVPRSPGKAVHHSAIDRSLASDPAADQGTDLTGIGQGVQFRAALPQAGPRVAT